MRSQKEGGTGKKAGASRTGDLFKACAFALIMVVFCAKAWAFEDPMASAALKSSLAPKSLLLDIAYSGNRMVAVGERGHIIYSDDNGQSWQQAEVPVRVMLTSVVFPGAGQAGWAAGHAGMVLFSGDAGETWVKQIDGRQVNQIMVDTFETAVSKQTEKLDAASGEERDPIQAHLEELEFLLEDANTFADEGPSRPFLDIYFHNEREGFAVGTFGMIIQTLDGGKTWTSPAAVIDNPDIYHYMAMTSIDNVLFLAGEKGFVSRSFDGGKSWERLASHHNGTFFGIAGDARGIMLVALRGEAMVSFDRGESWSFVETEEQATLTSAQVLSDGRILVSRNAKSLMISNKARTRLSALGWPGGYLISSFVLGHEGSLITVGAGGVTITNNPDFSAEVN